MKSAMHINVSDILAQDEGFRTSFEVVDETIELVDPPMAEPINGQITLGRSKTGISLEGSVRTAVALVCHRCLEEFSFPQELKIRGEFSEQPTVDDWPIEQDLTIDLSPVMAQEIIVQLPIKQLCRPDCPGLDPDTGQPKSSN